MALFADISGAHHRLKLTNTTKDNEPKDNAPTVKTTTQQNNHPTAPPLKQNSSKTTPNKHQTKPKSNKKTKPNPQNNQKNTPPPPNQNRGEGQPQLAGPEGFEPSANGLRGHRSNLAELRTHSKHPYYKIRFKSFSPPAPRSLTNKYLRQDRRRNVNGFERSPFSIILILRHQAALHHHRRVPPRRRIQAAEVALGPQGPRRPAPPLALSNKVRRPRRRPLQEDLQDG